MSTHDPFDGLYDDNPPAAAVAAERQKSESEDEPQDARKAERTQGETYSAPFLRRQDKADLQKIAKSRGLSADGGRDALADRILANQRK